MGGQDPASLSLPQNRHFGTVEPQRLRLLFVAMQRCQVQASCGTQETQENGYQVKTYYKCG
jgi:isochorismate hydrolase